MTPVTLPLVLAATLTLGQAAQKPTTIPITPAPEPVPALRYLLLPDYADAVAGNAAQVYYRAINSETNANLQSAAVQKELTEGLSAPLDLKELLKHDVLRLSSSNPFLLKHLDEAARRSYCDWDLLPRIRAEGIQMLLPELSPLRTAAQFLAFRTRLELARRQFDKAAYSLQTGLALSRNVADAPTLIHVLFGIAIGETSLNQIEEWIRIPRSPNLYWALSQLPQPFLNLKKPSQGEQMFILATVPLLKEALERRIEPGQLPALGKQMSELVQANPDRSRLPISAQEDLTLLCLRYYPAAKKSLVARGRKPADVEAMPVLQVVLLDAYEEVRRKNDAEVRWLALPYWQGIPMLAKEAAARGASRDEEGLLDMFRAAYNRVVWSMARFDRRIAALRLIEAIRLYAAGHDGRLPAKLSDITEVPLPLDPTTGKEFEYRTTDSGAEIWSISEYAPHPKALLYRLEGKK